jgi:hypothetical protein
MEMGTALESASKPGIRVRRSCQPGCTAAIVLAGFAGFVGACGHSGSSASPDGSVDAGNAWLLDAGIAITSASDAGNACRAQLCAHNSDTDLMAFGGTTFLVHRTGMTDVPVPNASLEVYRRDAPTDGGAEFTLAAALPAPTDRDIRAPHFFVTGTTLHLLALARLSVVSMRDTSVDTMTVESHSTDGTTWSPFVAVAPHGWSLWRVRENAGAYYAAAYQDGDTSVVLYSSPDGTTWTAGATIYNVAMDTPNETELIFMPSGELLALVRLDGTDAELLGDQGRLRTKTCWSSPPYTSFDCTHELDGERFDGPLAFLQGSHLFVIAREHLQGTGGRKRTALYELTGDFDAGALTARSLGDLPSAGDTSYAGIAQLDDTHALVTWYSSDVVADPTWDAGKMGPTDIWRGAIDLTKIAASSTAPSGGADASMEGSPDTSPDGSTDGSSDSSTDSSVIQPETGPTGDASVDAGTG